MSIVLNALRRLWPQRRRIERMHAPLRVVRSPASDAFMRAKLAGKSDRHIRRQHPSDLSDEGKERIRHLLAKLRAERQAAK